MSDHKSDLLSPWVCREQTNTGLEGQHWQQSSKLEYFLSPAVIYLEEIAVAFDRVFVACAVQLQDIDYTGLNS